MDPLRQRLKHTIATCMAKGIIDMFKLIDIDKKKTIGTLPGREVSSMRNRSNISERLTKSVRSSKRALRSYACSLATS